MLEAENRVLRLKGEQDKAHLAASHMLARDLATVNGTASPQLRGCVEGTLRASPHSSGMAAAMPEASDPTGISRQLGEVRDQLERERQESKSQIALLVARIEELALHGDSAGNKSANAESEGTCVDEAQDATCSGEIVAELEAKLDMAAQVHTKELLSAKELHAELTLELDARDAANKALLADLEAKTGEAAALSQRLKLADIERLRANQMFKDLVEEQELKADDSTEKSELVSKLRQEYLESEEQRVRLASELEVAQGQLSASETRLATALADAAQLEERSKEYHANCALLSLYHSHMCQVVELAQQHAPHTSGIAAGDELPVAYSTGAVTELYEKLQAAVMLLADTARADMPGDPDSAAAARGSADAGLRARIEELEETNERLSKERDQSTLQEALVNDYLGKLESECNRLVEDIEQLTSENQRLSEDLRMASLQNSTISLDIGALDAKLTGEQAESSGAQPSSDSCMRSNHGDGEDGGDSAGVQSRHAKELAAVQSQLVEIQQRKDMEIKKLQDELGSLEDLVEDKIFSESELNDKIASLSGEVERLRRDLQRAQGSSRASTNVASSAPLLRSPAAAVNRLPTAEEASDDEPTCCDICDARTHETACCPQLQATPSALFKQDVVIDSSRPYCDNCEAFAGHWTDECPHGDEMF
ncbi:hypothetical protein IWW39_004528 [Coemansia spiralis]|uniref:CLIP1 zinc knuckle domain-containing protein n=1 Tax=Coemansia spiralis TaxID=417178 RepID=A0A9W8GGZ4_9FUNG|nr:hypothetical protein IWW39_004528 [Coemansia spiralis]